MRSPSSPTRYWHAKTAIDALPIVWDEGENAKVSSATIAEFLKGGLDADQAYIGNKTGDAASAITGGARKIEAVYSYPFQNHATMEPMNATARYTAERCEVWGPSQNGEAALATIIEASGLPANKCDFYKVIVGGGFGRRGRTDYVRQAVLIAKEMPDVPIKMIWTREEDMTHCTYHPITQCKMTGALDANNNLVGLHMRISGQSISASLAPQNLQDGIRTRITSSARTQSGRPGRPVQLQDSERADRSCHAQHPPDGGLLARRQRQSQHDLCRMLHGRAGALGRAGPTRVPTQAAQAQEPRRAQRMRGEDRLRQAGPAGHLPRHGAKPWLRQLCGGHCGSVDQRPGPGEGPPHRGGDGSRLCGQSGADRAAGRRLLRVRPSSALLYGEITVKDGAVEQHNFDTYNVMRIAEMPQVDVIVMPSGGAVWGGVGEPTIAVAAPAVLNAIAAATGKRIRSVPLKSTDLRSA